MEMFELLKQEVIEIHYRWIIYRQVYAQGPDVTKLLNNNGVHFFYITQYLFLDYMALSFSKLTDQNKQGSNENLSLKQLIVFANDSRENDLAQELKVIFDTLYKSCEKFRTLRNKRIAHADLDHATGKVNECLPGISRTYVEDALYLLRKFMNTFEVWIQDSSTVYEETHIAFGTDGDALIESLRKVR